NVRQHSAESLGKMGAKAKGAVPALVKRVSDDVLYFEREKDSARSEERRVGTDQSQGRILEDRKTKNAEVRNWGTKRLDQAKDEDSPADQSSEATQGDLSSVVKALVDGLQDKDINVRQHSAESLGKMGAKAKSAIPALVKRVSDDVLYFEREKDSA